MVLHRLVDVEIGATRGVEAGEQFVHHDQQLHVGRFLYEQRLGLFLVGLGLAHAGLGLHVLEKICVGIEQELLVRLRVRTDFLLGNVLSHRVVRGYDGALALERRFLEQGEILARFVYASGHKDGVAAFVRKTGLHAEIENDIGNHLVHAGFGTEHLLHRAPLGFQFLLLPIIESLGFCIEPRINLGL